MFACVVIYISMSFLALWGDFLVQGTHSTNADLCGQTMETKLNSDGETSSVTVLLLPSGYADTCQLDIIAPATHLINMHWSENNAEIHRALIQNTSATIPPCMLSVFLSENTDIAVWHGDPCSEKPMPEIDLLTPKLRLVWESPAKHSYTRGRRLTLTAVGQGDECKNTRKHICMRIGWEPSMCISDQLLCDGNHNCPKGSTSSDEDEILCKTNLADYTSWEQLAAELFRKFRPAPGLINDKWLNDKLEESTSTVAPITPFINWKELKKFDITTPSQNKPNQINREDSVSTALSHYGPWGYLMLGMLVCGTVLMFCGLWECCFRRPKPRNTTLTQQQNQPPTTVLIINSTQDEVPTLQPPCYDDLDQPPSYTTLFPHYKLQSFEMTERVVSVSGSDNVDPSNQTLSEDISVSTVSQSETSDRPRDNYCDNERLDRRTESDV